MKNIYFTIVTFLNNWKKGGLRFAISSEILGLFCAASGAKEVDIKY
jgi:hypothetical protein